MLKLTIALCAVFFSSVTFVSSNPEIFNEKKILYKALHEQERYAVCERATAFASHFNREIMLASYKRAWALYFGVPVNVNIGNCRNLHCELTSTINNVLDTAHACVDHQRTDTIQEIDENYSQSMLGFDRIIHNAHKQKTLQFTAMFFGKKAKYNKALLNKLDTFSADTTNLLNLIMNRFEVSLATCTPSMTAEDIYIRAKYKLCEIENCINTNIEMTLGS